MTTPLYILADDLAGAHDVAVSFARRNFAVAVLSDPGRLDRFDSADLVVLNTNTRSCSESEATERVGAACEAIGSRNGSIIYKKIDSTLRGHVGLEIDLVSGLMDFSLAVCAPAFPELGRTTVGGYHLLHGMPVNGAYTAGPDIPPQHAFMPDLLDTGSSRKTVLVDWKIVQEGANAIREAVAGYRAEPGTTLVVDMADPTCWNGLLDAVLETGAAPAERGSSAAATASVLLCGSGGMARALADRWAAASRPAASSSSGKPRIDVASPESRSHSVLVFACSLHPTTVRQVEQVNSQDTATACAFDPLQIVDERSRGDEVDRLAARVFEVMANGGSAVVAPVLPSQGEQRAWLEGLPAATPGRDPASVVIESLGEVARRLLTGVSPGGLILTGGETACGVFDVLGADGAWILEELDTGVGLAAVAGGPHDGMRLVIKPGSFGDGQTLVKAVDRLNARSRGTQTADLRDRAGKTRSGNDGRPVIGITMGDPNGVGPEVIVKILSQEWVYDLCRPLVVGHDEVIRRDLPLAHATSPDAQEGRGPGPCLGIHRVDRPGKGRYRHGTVDVMNAGEVEIDQLIPGRVLSEAGRLAVESVKLAAQMALTGDIGAVVTAPLNKEAMGLAGYAFAGHTELLAEITGTKRFRLSLAYDGILVSHATTHVSLREAIDRLSEEEILSTVDLVGNALVGMGIDAPRIAVCGLNPHAGEGGLFGDEEIRIIGPALEEIRKNVGTRGWRIIGPLPPDTVFLRAQKGDFDGIVGMYHDQGHIPVKAIAFDRAVNVTLGLPIVRTSVDHGTAFDIAGKGVADAGNLGEALRMAVRLVGEQWSVGNGPGGTAPS